MLGTAIEVERAPVISSDEPCRNADEVFRTLPLLRCIVVVDDEMCPVGLVQRNDFLLQLSQRFGRALYENRPVRQLMNKAPLIVSETEAFDAFVRRSLDSGLHEGQDCFILTDEEGRYRGVSNNKAVTTALLDLQRSLLETLEHSQQQLIEANERLGKEVSVRRLAEEEAIKASHHDPLTGLSNRAPFVAALNQWARAGQAFSLIFVDLDGFKTINDVYGHLAGDTALKVVARRIEENCRDGICARFGGDEFAIAFRESACDREASTLASAMHDGITAPFRFKSQRLKTGASLGIAHFPQHGSTPGELLQAADMAMLRAKRSGGGIGVFSQEEDGDSRSARTQLCDLTNAIRSSSLIPYFQPVFDLGSGQPVIHEVLARWPVAPEPLGRPGTFIPMAEREGLIDDLFWLIFSKACHAARRHDPAAAMAFNVSARQLQNPKFPTQLLGAIERFEMNPCQFEVEVTETTMIADEKHADSALRMLADEGLSIALDDFGTGFSSLSVLHKFSFSKLKIDHSFVRRMSEDARSRDIVESTILMADRLGLQTAAEGVEDAGTLELLRKAGCDLVQGFHLARPDASFFRPMAARRAVCVA